MAFNTLKIVVNIFNICIVQCYSIAWNFQGTSHNCFFFKYTTMLYHSGLTSHYFHVVVWVTPLNECAVLQSYKEENAHKAAFSTVEKNFPPMYFEFSRLVKHGNNLYWKGLVDMCHLASSKLALNAGLFLLCE